MSFSVRPLEVDDWQEIRKIRLLALKENPGVYGGSYDEESVLSEQDWKVRIGTPGRRVFGLFRDAELVGIAAVFTWNGDPEGRTGILIMDFIAHGCRGKSLSRLLYKARIDWALAQDHLSRLIVSYREGNEASRRAAEASGFHFESREKVVWPDGVEAFKCRHVLDLAMLRRLT